MAIKVDLGLVRKYNRPGPRYTSYPTAPHFNSGLTIADWEEQIRSNNSSAQRDISLYFHLPFCDTLCWFCGCTMIVTRRREVIDEYVEVLGQEIDLIRKQLNRDRKVVQMHYGGGTPTHLSPEQIRRLGEKIAQSFTFAEDAEVGCEMDPRELTRDHLRALWETGFNRASMGVQDFNPQVQQAVNRINPLEMVREVVDWIRAEGFQSLNLDLIYGLPHQTRKTFTKTLDSILELDPDRLAVFNYAYVPWMKPHQKLIREEDLPGPEEKLSLLKTIIERLTSSGYVYIGMDHFAKETDELTIAQQEKTLQRNFQGYSTKSGADIYALGMSSISQLDTFYAQNYKELPRYYELVRDNTLPYEKGFLLSPDDRIRRQVIMRLMCDLELNYSRLSADLGIDFKEYFEGEIKDLVTFQEDGLIVVNEDGFSVTEEGRLFIRNIAMPFDAYLEKAPARYSKTV